MTRRELDIGTPPEIHYPTILRAGGLDPAESDVESFTIGTVQHRYYYERRTSMRIIEAFLDSVSDEAHDLQIEVEEHYTTEREDGESVSNARMAAEERAHERALEEADNIVYNFDRYAQWSIWVGLSMDNFRGTLKESGESMTTKMQYDLIEFAQTALWHLSTENLPPE